MPVETKPSVVNQAAVDEAEKAAANRAKIQEDLDKAHDVAVAKAEIAAHPTNRLKAVIADLQAHHGDINDRISAVQRGLLRFAQLALEGMPEAPPPYKEPEAEKDDGGKKPA